jgi:hypothetical protein
MSNTITRTTIPSLPWAAAQNAEGDAAPDAAQLMKAPEHELREKFDQFVGESFFGQLVKAMRQSVGKPAYFHGGRAEEVFQGQLDQALVERISESSAEKFTEPMFELFNLQRQR